MGSGKKEIAKQCSPLRQFKIFLELNDPERTHSSLKKVISNKNENDVWITEEIHRNIEKE